MIEPELARRFIEQVARYTDYNMSIMDEKGTVIASCDPGREGTFHPAAYALVRGTGDTAVTSGEDDSPGGSPGILMVLAVDGRREGAVGILGKPEELRPVALMARTAIEAILKYERHAGERHLRQSRKEHLLSLLTGTEHVDPELLRSVAAKLDYREDVVRIPILCRIEGGAAKLLSLIKSGPRHGVQDISFLVDDSQVLIFKAMPARNMLADYRFRVTEYLSAALRWLRGREQHCHFYIGSFQSSFPQYYYGYRHCKWLEQTAKGQSSPAFFYDYSGEYLREVTPMEELRQMFAVCEGTLDEDFKHSYREAVGALIKTNFSLAEAAKKLFVHKNTLAYRYNKIKDTLHVDPLGSASDRYYVEALYNYLERL